MTLFDEALDKESGSDTDPPTGSFILGTLGMVTGLLVYGLFIYGLSYAFYPGENSRMEGLLLILFTTPLILFTISRWVRYVPVLLGYAAIRGMVAVFTGSDLAAIFGPSRHPRLLALLSIAYCLGAAGLAITFTKRRLRTIDRIGLLSVAFAVAFAAAYPDPITEKAAPSAHGNQLVPMLVIAIGFFALVIAWAYDRAQIKRDQDSPRAGGELSGFC